MHSLSTLLMLWMELIHLVYDPKITQEIKIRLASYTWTANTETSNTQIDSAIDGNKMTAENNSNTRSNSMTFAFSGTDNVGAKIYRFECMDGEPFVTCISTNTVNVVDGTHTFVMRSEDNAGNKDSTPASYTWTVDTTPLQPL